jgi:hypothetical protein
MTLWELHDTRDPAYPPLTGHVKALAGESVTYEFEWEDRAQQHHLEPLRDMHGQPRGVV